MTNQLGRGLESTEQIVLDLLSRLSSQHSAFIQKHGKKRKRKKLKTLSELPTQLETFRTNEIQQALVFLSKRAKQFCQGKPTHLLRAHIEAFSPYLIDFHGATVLGFTERGETGFAMMGSRVVIKRKLAFLDGFHILFEASLKAFGASFEQDDVEAGEMLWMLRAVTVQWFLVQTVEIKSHVSVEKFIDRFQQHVWSDMGRVPIFSCLRVETLILDYTLEECIRNHIPLSCNFY